MTTRTADAALWMDWITIWQSEMAALAADREVHEAMQRAVDLAAAQAALLVLGVGPGDEPAGRPRADAPPGTAAARDAAAWAAELRALRDRVSGLESRLGPS